MVFGLLKKSKRKEEEDLDFLEDLESAKREILEPEFPKEVKQPPQIPGLEPIQPQPLPAPAPQQLPQLQAKTESRLEERESPEIYVKLDNYKKVLELLEKLKVKLKEIESIVNELKSVKESEVAKLEEIKDRLEKSKDSIGEVLENLK